MSGHRWMRDAMAAAQRETDPGNAGTFDVRSKSHVVFSMTSGSSAETRTLPRPVKHGQEVTLLLDTDGGGDVTVTVTGGFNQAGSTTMVFRDAGDYAHFVGCSDSGTFEWKLAHSDGVLSSLTFDAGGTDRFVINERDAYDVSFNPASRVYRRQQMAGRVYSVSTLSDSVGTKALRSAIPDWVISGSGTYGTSGDSDGGLLLSHNSATSAFVFMKPHTGGIFDTVKWSTSKTPRMRVVMKTGASIDDMNFVCGLYSAATAPNRMDGTAKAIRAEFFVDQAVNASWKVDVAGTGSSSVSGDCATAAAASTIYDLDLQVQSDRTVKAYINGSLVYTSTKVLTASKNLIPMIGLQAKNNVVRSPKIYHIELSRDI